MKSWRDKAHQIISELSREAYLKANTKKDGTRYKRHRPYTIPELADELVTCLGNPDQKAGELRAKQIFLYDI